MKNMIGERLEEARKRKNVSIRESAEATKIRGDYLMAMEDNSFDIPLPQIYIRGFLKNYARFLKLDPNKILTDYDAFLLGRSTPATHAHSGSRSASSRESLGHIEIPDEREDSPASAAQSEPEVVVTEAPEDEDGPDPELRFSLDEEDAAPSKPAAQPRPTTPPPTLEREGMRHDPESWNENKTLYMKIGIVFAGILLVSIILIVLIQLIRGGDESPAINPELATPSTQAAEPEAPSTTMAADDGTIVIRASDNVTLIVEQTIDRKRLYSGSLNAGESLSLDREGPVSIRFTNGSALVIEQGGRQVRPSQAGVGRTVVE
jgi:transcriptional regulator with XRE-family HTH domain